jgi:protein gp37
MHPDWVRSLRDQCGKAGVPFFFKQWGEWAEDPERKYAGSRTMQCLTRIGECLGAGIGRGSGLLDPNWREKGGAYMVRVGKGKAGRALDGREWNEFPKPYPGHEVIRLQRKPKSQEVAA